MIRKSATCIIASIVCFLTIACDSGSLHPQAHSEEAMPSRAELQRQAESMGLNPDYVDFDQMAKNGTPNSFVSRPIVLTAKSVEMIEDRWPGRLDRDLVNWHRQVSSSTLEKRGVYVDPLPPPTMTDQDQCFGLEVGDYDAPYCECLRDPAMCESHHPDNDGGTSNGGGDDPDSSDNETAEENSTACGDITSNETVSASFEANVDAFRDRSGFTQFQTYAATGVRLVGWDRVCYNSFPSVDVEIYRITYEGDRVLVMQRSESPFISTATAQVGLAGSIEHGATQRIEQESFHVARVKSKPLPIFEYQKEKYMYRYENI